MTRQRATQTMKPATAAKKLGVHLDATPAEFRAGPVSRDELDALQADPPAWLRDLRRDGPHPRPVVADRLGVSISGLARAEITEPLTTAQITALKEEQPEWLRRERNLRAEVQREEARLRAERSGDGRSR
ncbi:DUF5997 family protein [Actinomycetospora rhizophila]|uniref:DUF5997 family protein n=1 Tax=Actinomycetospora rhizophila TaxID=1416876 RepID=A0ABV9ZD85_9PSEU